ncbi:MAG: CPBP family glutamic-type intramembrane protease [Bacteroidetes bacterium]|jgi:hypothetical protein|nr:CPBP family glutamic-type intramembrane protease [Bacteroidota bacterium]
MIKSIFIMLFEFFKTATVSNIEIDERFSKNRVFIFLFIINLAIGILLTGLSGYLRIKFDISFKISTSSVHTIWLLNLLFVPLIEELAYRLPLIFRKRNILISSIAITYIFISQLFSDGIIDINTNLSAKLLSISLIGTILVAMLSKNSIEKKAISFWNKNPRSVLFSYLIIFSLGHFDNYIFSVQLLILFPVLVLPQFIGGFFLSFVRVKVSFIHAIIFHVLNNFLALFPQIVLFYIVN